MIKITLFGSTGLIGNEILKLLENDDLANELKKIMASGNLVSDDILNSIVSSRLSKEFTKGF